MTKKDVLQEVFNEIANWPDDPNVQGVLLGEILDRIASLQPVVDIKLQDGAQLPSNHGQDSNAGYDLYSNEKAVIFGGQRATIDTGVSLCLPPGYFGHVLGRSGLAAKNGISILGGVIDNSYRGTIKVVLLNTGNSELIITKGDRIAQLVVIPYVNICFNQVDNLDATERGEKGMGSTGK